MTTALEGGEGSASHLSLSLPPGKDLVPILQEAGWAPGSVWTGVGNLAPTGKVRSVIAQENLRGYLLLHVLKNCNSKQ